MLLSEYLEHNDLMTSSQRGSFNAFMPGNVYANLKTNLSFAYGAREIDIDDAASDFVTRVQNQVTCFFSMNSYRYGKLFDTIDLAYDLTQIEKITESGTDSTRYQAGTSSTTTPANYTTTHKDRTYDNDTLENVYSDTQSGSITSANSGTDTTTNTYGKVVTREGSPIEQIMKERDLAMFNYVNLMCRELTNYLCLRGWCI